MTQTLLTTVANVKERLKVGSSDTTIDAVLTRIVTAASQAIEIYIARPLPTAARTEEYDWEPRKTVLFLRAYPVTSIASIKFSLTWDFVNVIAEPSTSYRVDADTGAIYFSSERTWVGTGEFAPKAIQVVYTAGLGVDAAAIVVAFPALSEAAEIESVARYIQGKNPAGGTKRLEGESIQYESSLKMTKAAREILEPFRRERFGLG